MPKNDFEMMRDLLESLIVNADDIFKRLNDAHKPPNEYSLRTFSEKTAADFVSKELRNRISPDSRKYFGALKSLFSSALSCFATPPTGSNVPSDIPLDEIVVPVVRNIVVPGAGDPIESALNAGIRGFHFDVSASREVVCPITADLAVGSGRTLSEVFRTIADFVRTTTGSGVLVNVGEVNDDSGVREAVIDDATRVFGDYILLPDGENLPTWSDLGGSGRNIILSSQHDIGGPFHKSNVLDFLRLPASLVGTQHDCVSRALYNQTLDAYFANNDGARDSVLMLGEKAGDIYAGVSDAVGKGLNLVVNGLTLVSSTVQGSRIYSIPAAILAGVFMNSDFVKKRISPGGIFALKLLIKEMLGQEGSLWYRGTKAADKYRRGTNHQLAEINKIIFPMLLAGGEEVFRCLATKQMQGLLKDCYPSTWSGKDNLLLISMEITLAIWLVQGMGSGVDRGAAWLHHKICSGDMADAARKLTQLVVNTPEPYTVKPSIR